MRLRRSRCAARARRAACPCYLVSPVPSAVVQFGREERALPIAAERAGWAALLRQVAGTVVGGYLLLMAVVVAYYFGVARVGPGFLEGVVTGTALLLGLAAPVFAVLSWLAARRRRS